MLSFNHCLLLPVLTKQHTAELFRLPLTTTIQFGRLGEYRFFELEFLEFRFYNPTAESDPMGEKES